MNDIQLINVVAETDAHAPNTPLPATTWSRDAALAEIERRMGMESRDTTRKATPSGVTDEITPPTSPTALREDTDGDRLVAGRIRRHWVPGLVAAAIVLVVGTVFAVVTLSGGDDEVIDTPEAGPMTIETEIDFSAQAQGTFEVTEGADILGCSSGTFVDTARDVDVRKDFTCGTGTKEGTFTVVFNPLNGNGPWRILEGTGDFTALQGEGDFTWSFTGEAKGVETFSGDIEYTSFRGG